MKIAYPVNSQEAQRILEEYGLTKDDVRGLEKIIEIDKSDILSVPLKEGNGIKHSASGVSIDLKKLYEEIKRTEKEIYGIYRIGENQVMEIGHVPEDVKKVYPVMESPYDMIILYEILSERENKLLMVQEHVLMIPPLSTPS